MEDSPSGLWRTLGKRVGVTASRVRISYPPPAGFSEVSENPFFAKWRNSSISSRYRHRVLFHSRIENGRGLDALRQLLELNTIRYARKDGIYDNPNLCNR